MKSGVEDRFEYWGCGHKGETRGRSRHLYTHGAASQELDERPAEARTCPWYYHEMPFVQGIVSLISDYNENRIGPIWDLPAPLVDYLRVAADEFSVWQKTQQDIIDSKV